MARRWLLLLMIFVAWSCTGMDRAPAVGEAPRISKEDLKARLGSPDITIIDVRTEKDWSADNTKIAGAVRENPKEFSEWAGKYPKDRTLVLYCA